MDNKLQIFNFNNSNLIRTAILNNNIFFVAKDMAEALEYPESKNALRLCKNINTSPSGELNKINDLAPATKWIGESDLYRLIMKSTKPEAEKFQDWICEEVIPAIRKTGSYSIQPKELTRLEILTMAIEAEKKVLLLESKIEEDKPKVELANDLLDSIGLLGIRLAAKEIGIPPMTLYEVLRKDGITDAHNIMYQRYINMGLGEIKANTKNGMLFSSTLFTPKGLTYLHKRYKDLKKV